MTESKFQADGCAVPCIRILHSAYCAQICGLQKAETQETRVKRFVLNDRFSTVFVKLENLRVKLA